MKGSIGSGRPAAVLGLFCVLFAGVPRAGIAQRFSNSIVSKHIRIRIPVERQWFGRKVIADLEQCRQFIDRSTDGKLPDVILVAIRFDSATSSSNLRDRTVTIGMDNPAAGPDTKAYLLHSAAGEMARMALLNLSGNRAAAEENRFLLEGMAELLAHEYSLTVRSLGGAWVVSSFLDRMGGLGLEAQMKWTEFSGGRSDFSAAAPGITLLSTCGDVFGRGKTVKLFKEMEKKGLEEALNSAFGSSAARIEAIWLERVRKYRIGDIAVTGDGDVPMPGGTKLLPEEAEAGTPLLVRFDIRDEADNFFPWGLFVLDEKSGRIVRGQAVLVEGKRQYQVKIPIEADRASGRYQYRATAVDLAGNVHNWTGSYAVK